MTYKKAVSFLAYKALAFLVLLGISSHSLASPQCKDVFRYFEAKHIPVYAKEWAVPNQCHGTCYFEASVSHLENVLSRHYQTPHFISRAHLFAHLTVHRLIEAISSGKLDVDQISGEAKGELISGGLIADVMRIVDTHGVLILGQKTKTVEFIETEDALLQWHYTQLKALVEQYNTGQLGQTDLIEFAQGLRNQTISQVREYMLDPISTPKSVDNLLRVSKYYVHRITQSMDLRKVITEAVDDNHSLSFIFRFGAFDYINSRGEYFQEVIRPNAVPYRETGLHAVVITGYIKNSMGRMTHIILRNSWGKDSGDQGYIYMPYALFMKRVQYIEYVEVVL